MFSPPKRSKYTLIQQRPPKVHMVSYVSGGLGQLYKELQNNNRRPPAKVGEYTDEDGCFAPQPDMPLLANRYRFLRILGKGQSSVLARVQDTFQGSMVRAVKVLHTHYSLLGVQESDCVRRINLADPYDTSGTLRFCNAFSYHKHYCMVFELLAPDPLTDYFRDMCADKVISAIRKVALRLLQALGFLQQQNVIHADLKPANILLRKGGDLSTLKVVDFGNAIHCIHEEMSLYYEDFELQTLLYRAPEVVFGLPFGLEVDMWSLGCVLAELYIARPLFCGSDKIDTLTNTTDLLGPLPEEVFKRGKFYSELSRFTCPMKDIEIATTPDLMEQLECNDYAFVDFLRLLLQYNPNERLTVVDAARHPFLAPEIGVGYIVPSSAEQAYPTVLLDHQNYTKRPFIDEHRKRHRLSSTELLREGTSSSPTTTPKVKVARVMPMPQHQNMNNKNSAQEPVYAWSHATPGSNVTLEENPTFRSNDVRDKTLTYRSMGLKRKVKIVQREIRPKARYQWSRGIVDSQVSSTRPGHINPRHQQTGPPHLPYRQTTGIILSTPSTGAGLLVDRRNSITLDGNIHSGFQQGRSEQQMVAAGRATYQSESAGRQEHTVRESQRGESVQKVGYFPKATDRVNQLPGSAGRGSHLVESVGRVNHYGDSVGGVEDQQETALRVSHYRGRERNEGINQKTDPNEWNSQSSSYAQDNAQSLMSAHSQGLGLIKTLYHRGHSPSTLLDPSGNGEVNLLSPSKDSELITLNHRVKMAPCSPQTGVTGRVLHSSPTQKAIRTASRTEKYPSNDRKEKKRSLDELHSTSEKHPVKSENTLESRLPRPSQQHSEITPQGRALKKERHVRGDDEDLLPFLKSCSQTLSQKVAMNKIESCVLEPTEPIPIKDNRKKHSADTENGLQSSTCQLHSKRSQTQRPQTAKKSVLPSRNGHSDGRVRRPREKSGDKMERSERKHALAKNQDGLTKDDIDKLSPQSEGAHIRERSDEIQQRLRPVRVLNLCEDSSAEESSSEPDEDDRPVKSVKKNLLEHYRRSPGSESVVGEQPKKSLSAANKTEGQKLKLTKKTPKKTTKTTSSPVNTKKSPARIAKRRRVDSPREGTTPRSKRKRPTTPVVESSSDSETSGFISTMKVKKRNTPHKIHPSTPKRRSTPARRRTTPSGASGRSRQCHPSSPNQVDVHPSTPKRQSMLARRRTTPIGASGRSRQRHPSSPDQVDEIVFL